MTEDTTVQQPPPRRVSPTTGAAAGAGLVGVVFTEAALIGLVALLGPLGAFVVVTIGCSLIAALISYTFDAEEDGRGTGPLVARARAWIALNRGRARQRAGRLVDLSEGLAFAVLSVTVGPFLTTVAVKLRGAGRRSAYLLAIASSVLFSAVWVAIYAGGLAVVEKMFGN